MEPWAAGAMGWARPDFPPPFGARPGRGADSLGGGGRVLLVTPPTPCIPVLGNVFQPAVQCWNWGVNTECCPYGMFETKTPHKPCRSVKYD
ncbi:hypothetical protein GmRootA79_50090 [Acidovorax sp. A79]